MVSDFAYFQVPGTGSSGKSFDIPFSLVIQGKIKKIYKNPIVSSTTYCCTKHEQTQ